MKSRALTPGMPAAVAQWMPKAVGLRLAAQTDQHAADRNERGGPHEPTEQSGRPVGDQDEDGQAGTTPSKILTGRR
jgi:hypothetical protein